MISHFTVPTAVTFSVDMLSRLLLQTSCIVTIKKKELTYNKYIIIIIIICTYHYDQ